MTDLARDRAPSSGGDGGDRGHGPSGAGEPVDDGPETRPSVREWALVVGLAAVVVVVLAVLADPDQGLGVDEAEYVLRARDFRAGVLPGAGRWGDVRAPGLPRLLSLVPGGSIFGMRLVPILFGGVGIVVTWLLARVLFGRRVALVAAILLALTPGWLIWSWYVLVDVPGAVLGLAAITVVAWATAGGRFRWWAFAAVPLAVAATYVRYGAPVVIGVSLVILLVYRWPVVRRHVVTAAGLALAVLVPMAAILTVPALTGSNVSPSDANRALSASFSFPPLQAARDFRHQLPGFFGFHSARDLGSSGLAGIAADAAIVLGTLFILVLAASWVWALVLAARGDHRRPVLLVAANVAGIIGALVVVLWNGEERYLAPVAPWIVIGAAFGLSRSVEKLPRWIRGPGWLVLALPALLFAAELPRSAEHGLGPRREVARVIASDREGCVLVSNVVRMEVAALADCELLVIPTRADGTADVAALQDALADVPIHDQAFLLNVDRENLYFTESASVVDLGELETTFGLHEIDLSGVADTELRLFVRD